MNKKRLLELAGIVTESAKSADEIAYMIYNIAESEAANAAAEYKTALTGDAIKKEATHILEELSGLVDKIIHDEHGNN